MMNGQMNKELETINIYTQSLGDGIAKQRIEQLLDWNIRKAYFYKNLFYAFNIIVIIINAAIPVITVTSLDKKDIIIASISAIASILTSILTLATMKDSWFRYRDSVEEIKSECMKFACKLDDYSSGKECVLLRNVEIIVASERGLWKQSKFSEDVK